MKDISNNICLLDTNTIHTDQTLCYYGKCIIKDVCSENKVHTHKLLFTFFSLLLRYFITLFSTSICYIITMPETSMYSFRLFVMLTA